ncbi:MAG: hypothetical protein DHS20C10_05280 [marine bacterium B5-7]|nr:MAG: hypothetical protein DHS20C10_05280 [marine bacterium B5-7]
MVHFLLKNGADVELGFGTETPLSAAVNHDFNDIVVMLLHAGAKVEGNTNNCSLPLSTALYKKNEAIVHLLLKHNMNVSATGYHGTTALHIAASYGRDTIATYLLARGADASANKTHTKNTPLHNATEKGFTQCAAVLIQAAPTVINQQNMTDETPLHIAAKKGHQAIVQLMLHSGTAQLDLEDEWGCTPYQIAKQHNHEAVAQLLAEHHANTPSSSQKKLAYTM